MNAVLRLPVVISFRFAVKIGASAISKGIKSFLPLNSVEGNVSIRTGLVRFKFIGKLHILGADQKFIGYPGFQSWYLRIAQRLILIGPGILCNRKYLAAAADHRCASEPGLIFLHGNLLQPHICRFFS